MEKHGVVQGEGEAPPPDKQAVDAARPRQGRDFTGELVREAAKAPPPKPRDDEHK